MESEKLLAKLSAAVTFTFKQDATCPGVLFSTLKDGTVYASVVRYGKEFATGKKVVCKANAVDLPTALTKLTNEFLSTKSQAPKNPVEELAELVSKKG